MHDRVTRILFAISRLTADELADLKYRLGDDFDDSSGTREPRRPPPWDRPPVTADPKDKIGTDRV